MATGVITAPRGHKAATARALKGVELNVTSGGSFDIEAATPEQQALINQLARVGDVTFERRGRLPESSDTRIRLSPERVTALAPIEILQRACSPAGPETGWLNGTKWGSYFIPRDAAARELLRRAALPRGATLDAHMLAETLARIGPAGEQARADEERYFDVWNERPSSQRVNRAEIDTIDVAPGYTAALVTRHVYTLYHSQLRSSSVECYLVVRDSTTNERHVLRVPPKFGKRTSVTRQLLLKDGPAAVVQAAIAWTFGLRPDQYHPDVER